MSLFFNILLACCLSVFNWSVYAANPVVLLIRELRTETGELQPLQAPIQHLIHFLELKAELKFEIHRYPWNRVLASARQGEGIVFGLSKTNERLREFQFSELLFSNYVWLIQRNEDRFVFNDWPDLEGKRLGILRGVSYGDEFEKYKNIVFLVDEDTGSLAARLKKLHYKRVDGLLWSYWHSDRNVAEVALSRQFSVFSYEFPSGVKFNLAKKYIQRDDLYFAAQAEKFDVQLDKLNRVLLKYRTEINAILAQ